jgi:hypothetical protein
VSGVGFAVIVYGSGDTGIATDAIATSPQMARSAFLLRNCVDTVVEGLSFFGDNQQDVSTVNLGLGIYATRCSGNRILNCTQYRGNSLYGQDANVDTTGTGDSLAVSAGTVTLTDAGATFSTHQRLRNITVSGCTNQLNNGTFVVLTRPSATTVTYYNPAAVNETSSFAWSIDDGDRDTRIDNCRLLSNRAAMWTCSNSVISNCLIERPMGLDLTGIGDYLTDSGTTTTLVDARAKFGPWVVGKYIYIQGASTGANNGIFLITAYNSATSISYTNAGAAATEAFTGTWWIQNGDKTGLGAGATAIAEAAGIVTFTAAADSFTASDVGKLLRVNIATTEANEGGYIITSYISPTQVTYTNANATSETFSGMWGVD